MPTMRDFLSRFRPSGTPGGRAVVPANRRREREAELGPVLMMLDESSADGAAFVAAAQLEAEQIISAARDEAAGIVAAGRQQADATFARLVREATEAAHAEAGRVAAAGVAESAATTDRAGRRLPELAGRAVALVRGLSIPDGAP